MFSGQLIRPSNAKPSLRLWSEGIAAGTLFLRLASGCFCAGRFVSIAGCAWMALHALGTLTVMREATGYRSARTDAGIIRRFLICLQLVVAAPAVAVPRRLLLSAFSADRSGYVFSRFTVAKSAVTASADYVEFARTHHIAA